MRSGHLVLPIYFGNTCSNRYRETVHILAILVAIGIGKTVHILAILVAIGIGKTVHILAILVAIGIGKRFIFWQYL